MKRREKLAVGAALLEGKGGLEVYYQMSIEQRRRAAGIPRPRPSPGADVSYCPGCGGRTLERGEAGELYRCGVCHRTWDIS